MPFISMETIFLKSRTILIKGRTIKCNANRLNNLELWMIMSLTNTMLCLLMILQ